ncbi:MAG: hypothetical protein DDT32_02174 [Syntrophomonadaceae bacterium]|nr:hypothetical protein [Bacillota bacterium]
MKIDDFKKRLEDRCRGLNLLQLKITRQGFSFLKVEIRVKPELNIEIYFNEETQSLTTALVIQDERVFGIDSYPRRGAWHMHPFGRIGEHVKINPMQIEQIMEEYAKALRQL